MHRGCTTNKTHFIPVSSAPFDLQYNYNVYYSAERECLEDSEEDEERERTDEPQHAGHEDDTASDDQGNQGNFSVDTFPNPILFSIAVHCILNHYL